MVGTHSDITERELGSLIFNNCSQAIVVTDVNHNVISVNPTFNQITGYASIDVLGKNVAFFRSDKHDQKLYDEVVSSLGKKGKWVGEVWGRCKDGNKRNYC